MKQKRKEELLHQFPDVPNELKEKMKGKGASNFCVFLTKGRELFVRCYHRYSKNGKIIERQRYVFAKDGTVRYIFDDWKGWRIATKFREPVFCSVNYGYTFDNSYRILNFEAVAKSDMKYSQLRQGESLPIFYLKLYCRYPNIEYLVKSGYGHLIKEYCTGYWGGIKTLEIDKCVNLKSNNLLKMLQLNRTEFKLLQGREQLYESYISCREKYPNYKSEALLMVASVYGSSFGTMEHHRNLTGMTVKRLAQYLFENKIALHDYCDYLRQCQKLKYNLRDTAISLPHNFYAMHERLSEIITEKSNKILNQLFEENYESRREFEFEYGNLFLRQPENLDEIIEEGKALCHCVGGYTERHAKAYTNIFFIRKKSEPDIPYYTIEVKEYCIKQCRGYRNDRQGEKPQEVKDFEEQYSKYLEELKNVRNRIKLKSA